MLICILILELQNQNALEIIQELLNMHLLERDTIGTIILDRKQILLVILSLMIKKLKITLI